MLAATPLDRVRWIHGAPDCATSSDPLLQVHQFDADTFIIRQSKCSNFEAPFLYLLAGRRRVVLVDSGAAPNPGATPPPVRATVDRILEERQRRHPRDVVDLVVAHTHSHGDHVAGDAQFAGRPRTTVVGRDLPSITSFYRLPQWPEGQATLDLGGRVLTILPLPGHHPSHIAIHDSRTHILLTGDSLYPGLLTVRDVAAYRRSAERLARFAAAHPIAHVLGNHIEMQRTPRLLYPIGTTFQPDEHPLPLIPADLEEWRAACDRLSSTPHQDVHDRFIIEVL
jgi:glyoxylase-like metal-dependent hydrolase (beta-lactamase superfamily II)